jgi:hypothetical protein
MRRKHVTPAFTLATLLLLAACGGTDGNAQRSFGLVRDTPDEFEITTVAPLSIPPGVALSPPAPGAPRPQEQSARQQAEAALLPQIELNPAAADSKGQDALVRAAGPPAPGDIRLELAKDKVAPRLLNVVVDPAREAARLAADKAHGRSPLVGETPVIKPASGGLFGGLL